MIRRFLILYLTVLAVSLTNSLVTAQSAESDLIVKLETGTEYVISNINDVFDVRVPVTLKKGVTKVKPFLVDAAVGKRHDQALTQLFAPEMEEIQGGENRIPALIIHVKTKNLAQGTYQLLIKFLPIEVSEGIDITKLNNQLVTLDLKLPTAILQSPTTINVEQTIPILGASVTGNSSLLLRETSGQQTQLNSLTIQQLEINSAKGSTPSLNFSSPPVMAPMSIEKFPVTLTGTFPIGKTSGTAIVTSPQLAQPLLVNFEVRGRRPAWYIFPTILLGLIIGFGTRTWAQRQIDLYEARSKVSEVINRLKQEQSKHQDAVFQETVQNLIIALESAKEVSDTESMASTIKATNDQLASALQDLDSRRSTAKTLLETLSKLSADRQSLPREISTVFEIEKPLNEVREKIALDNISGAKQTLDALLKNANQKLREQSLLWSSEAKSFLRNLRDIAPLLSSESDANNFIQNADSVINKLSDDALANDGETLETQVQTVSAIRSAQFKLRQFLTETQILFTATINFYQNQFNQVLKPDKSSIDELFTKLNEFQLKLVEWIRPDTEFPHSIQAEVANLKAVWRKALLAQLSKDEDIKDSVIILLDEEKYREATAVAIKFLSPNPSETLSGNELSLMPQMAVAPIFGIPLMSFQMQPAMPSFVNIINEKTIAPVFELFKPGSPLNYILANWLRFIVASIGIIAVGYVVFADNFEGTCKELLGIFVWAFGIDISVNSFISWGGKLKG